MKTLRCLFLGVIVAISSATFALGGEIQQPGKSAPTPTPTPTVLITASTTNGATQPTSTEIQIVWPDATTMFVEILFTIF